MCFTTVLEKQPKFLSVGKISFRVHVGITTVLEKQPKFECWKNIIPSSCRNFLECENRIGNEIVIKCWKHLNSIIMCELHCIANGP